MYRYVFIMRRVDEVDYLDKVDQLPMSRQRPRGLIPQHLVSDQLTTRDLSVFWPSYARVNDHRSNNQRPLSGSLSKPPHDQ